MKNINKNFMAAFNCGLVKFFVVMAVCMPAGAVVLHPGYEPLPSWSERPSSNVIGRWSSNASCTAVTAHSIATTNHQGGGLNTQVVIGGQVFKVARVERYGTTDIRVARLRYATLTDYIPPYTGSSERLKSFVFGGYGMGRGIVLQTSGITYGYMWDGLANTTLRWGTNSVDSVRSSENQLEADFDKPGTGYEAILAQFDSGGGWFIKVDKTWQLMGITYTVETHEGFPSQCWFKDPVTLADSPDKFYAHRVSSYASWINTTSAKLDNCGSLPEDISEDCKVDIDDIKELAAWWCSLPQPAGSPRQQSDINADTAVNMLDFAKLAAKWNQNYW